MKIDRQVLPARRWRRPAARRSMPPHRDGASPGRDAPRHLRSRRTAIILALAARSAEV